MEASETQEVETGTKEEAKEHKHGKFFRTRHDVTFPRVVAKTGEGKDATYQVEGVNYPAGSVISAEGMTPYHQEQLEKGNLEHLLEPISDEEAEAQGGEVSLTGGEPEFGVFVAEHEAEAHALQQYGHHVVPDDQALELGSASEAYAAQYQQAVKDAGMDARPHLEATSPANRPRIPDEILYGTETRSGAPHYRGPAGAEGEEGEQEAEEAGAATRPRPDVSEAGNDSESTEESEGEV